MNHLTDMNWLLTAGIFAPLAGALVMMFIPRAEEQLHKYVALAASLVALVFGVITLAKFKYDQADSLQFYVNKSWIPVIKSRYILGMDGIGMPLYVLSMAIVVLCIIYSWNHLPAPGNPKAFFALILILEVGMNGTFVAQDLILFFVFFELVLLPMYFMIGVWGGESRQYASIKFFLFTLFGSAFMLLAFLALFFKTGASTFGIQELAEAVRTSGITKSTQTLIFAGMFLGFAIKVPMFPFHTWLPDAHTDAPTAGSVVLAGVMLKMGTYGFLRFAIPMFPQAAVDLAPILLVLAVIGITYGAIVAAMQPNLKRIIAYSSVAHLGFVVLGVFALTNQGISGGLFTMLSHGLTTGALFLLVGMLYDRRHTYELSDFRGIWKVAPVFGGLFVAATFASIGLPGFSGFVGEFLSLLGAFLTSRWYAVVAATGVILAAVYLLWAVQRAFTGVPDDENRATPDIGVRELVTVVPLLGLSLFLGFYPAPVLDRVQPSVQQLIDHIEHHSNYKTPSVPNPSVAANQGESK
jgi:NADH-quinone oxidoreductase subunit M